MGSFLPLERLRKHKQSAKYVTRPSVQHHLQKRVKMTAQILTNGTLASDPAGILKRKAKTNIDHAILGRPKANMMDRPYLSDSLSREGVSEDFGVVIKLKPRNTHQ